MSDSVKAHYLDASVLVKIAADDADETPGRDVFRAYYFNNPLMFTNSFCVAECLSAFKLKFLRGRIGRDDYLRYIREFYRLGVGAKIQLEDLDLLAPQLRSETDRLITAHSIDFIDAVQVVTLLQGRFRYMVQGSQSILITADRGLAAAARAEGARVWECTTEPAPV